MSNEEQPHSTTRLYASGQNVWELLSGLQTLRATLNLQRIPASSGEIGTAPPAPDADAGGLTVILGAEPQHDALVVDALRQAPANLTAGEMLLLETQVEGRRLGFHARLREILQLADGPAYVLEHPEIVQDEQRRAAYRVILPSALRLEAALASRNSYDMPARVVDISSLGFGAHVSRPVALPDGVRVDCALTLPDVNIYVEATVRHHETAAGMTRVGLQFSEITPLLESELSRAVFQLERRLIRGDQPPLRPSKI